MTNLKDLKKLIALCRSQGVESVEYNGIKLTLGSLPSKERRSMAQPKEAAVEVSFDPGTITVQEYVADVIESDGITDEELLFMSADSGTQN